VSCVPIVPVTPTPQPSRQSQELADLLGRVVQEYEKAHPTVSGAEVRQALQLARRASTKDGGLNARALRAFAAGFLVLGMAVFVFFRKGGSLDVGQVPIIEAILGAGVVVGVAALLRRAR
jgi:hypothetical protein